MKLWILLLASTLMAASARADIAPNPMSGGVSIEVPGQSNTQIVLERNTVRMRVSPSLCRTCAWFKLRNTGPATELEVGFPLMRDRDASPDFVVFIDGQKVEYKTRSEDRENPIKQKFTIYWKVWSMNFAIDEVRLVEVQYSNAVSSASRLNIDDSDRIKHIEIADHIYAFGRAAPSLIQQLRDAMEQQAIEYLLVTGSYWNHPVNYCHVEITLVDIELRAVTHLWPPPHTFTKAGFTWIWLNSEPSYNVAIGFMPASFWQMKPKLEQWTQQYGENADALFLLKFFRDSENDLAIEGILKSFQKQVKESIEHKGLENIFGDSSKPISESWHHYLTNLAYASRIVLETYHLQNRRERAREFVSMVKPSFDDFARVLQMDQSAWAKNEGRQLEHFLALCRQYEK